MIKKLQRKYALSERGAKDLVKGIAACVFQNISMMIPVSLLYYLIGDLMQGGIQKSRIAILILFALILAVVVLYNLGQLSVNDNILTGDD